MTLSTVALALLSMTWTSMASAEDVVCDGTLASPTRSGVLVPPGATCVVEGGRIRGDLEIAEGAVAKLSFLQVEGSVNISQGELSASGSTIQGSLSAADGVVNLQSTAVNGTTTLSNGSLSTDRADFRASLALSGSALTATIGISQMRGEVTVESGRSFSVETSKAARGISLGKGASETVASINDSKISGTIRITAARNFGLDGSQIAKDLALGDTRAIVDNSTIGRNLLTSPSSSVRLERSAIEGDLKAMKTPITSIRTRVGGKVVLAKGGNFRAEVSKFQSAFTASGPGLVLVAKGSNFKKGLTVKAAKSVFISKSKVAGNAQVAKSRGPVAVEVSSIAGSLRLRGNRSPRGSIRVFRNRILGSLECEGNKPVPSGGRNGVRGAKKGQCARL